MPTIDSGTENGPRPYRGASGGMEKIPRVYANVVQFHGSPFEVTMDFGSRVEGEDPDYDVRVAMSWTHAKLMLAVLKEQIEGYERQLGGIPDLVAIAEERDE